VKVSFEKREGDRSNGELLQDRVTPVASFRRDGGSQGRPTETLSVADPRCRRQMRRRCIGLDWPGRTQSVVVATDHKGYWTTTVAVAVLGWLKH
jgi:hypothetical protein